MPPETCPNCGADVPRKARCCPGCGADERTGWSEEAYASSLDLPDDSFDYNAYVQREFGQEQKVKPHAISWVWWITAVVLLLLGVYFLVGMK